MKTKIVAAFCVVMLTAASAHAAIEFQLDSYQIDVNDSDPGLIIQTANLLPNNTVFQLDNVGDMITFDLFEIWTNESSVNSGEDDLPMPASVTFNFSKPPPAFGGTQDGSTVGGRSGFFGFFQSGAVEWDDPVIVNFGALGDGELQIQLMDAEFNDGLFFGLDEGRDEAGTVEVKFTLLSEASVAATPEPTAAIVWSLLGCSAIAVTGRRRRAA